MAEHIGIHVLMGSHGLSHNSVESRSALCYCIRVAQRSRNDSVDTFISCHRESARMNLLHVCLNVENVEESIRFYTEQLDFEESWSFESGDTVNRYVVADNGAELQLSDTEGEDIEVGSAWDHLAVSVEDVDAAFERIDHYGVIQEPKNQPAAGARTAFVEDPDGHVVELIEPLEQ